jgi:hypothetical protein
MIQIHGLNQRQRAIADMIWAMEDHKDVLEFIDGCQGRTKRDAQVVYEMIVLAVIDQRDEVTPELKEELDRILKR